MSKQQLLSTLVGKGRGGGGGGLVLGTPAIHCPLKIFCEWIHSYHSGHLAHSNLVHSRWEGAGAGTGSRYTLYPLLSCADTQLRVEE